MSVIFAGGGTIGPITSLIPIIEALRKEGVEECNFIAPRGSQGKELVEATGATWNEVPAGKLARHFSFSWITLPFNIFRGYFAAGKLLEKYDAKVVITSGSFVSPPVVWQAKRRKIPIVVIQLDILMGISNKLSAKHATKVFYSYKTKDVAHEKDVIGPVMRRPRVNKKNVFIPPGFEDSIPTIFITGGGTGAKKINDIVCETLPALTNRANIVHATGRGKETKTIGYKRYLQVPFLDTDNYYYWLERASIVIGRSGMGFFSDCVAYRKPTISIPIPNSHQEINVHYFANHNAVITPESDKAFTGEWLIKTIDTLFSDAQKLLALKESIGRFENRNTVQILVSEIQQLHDKSSIDSK